MDVHPCSTAYLMLSIQQSGLHTSVVFPTQMSVVLPILGPHGKQGVTNRKSSIELKVKVGGREDSITKGT